MTRIKTQTVKGKVERLGTILSELVLLYRDPANAADFAQYQAALCTALTKHQLLCAALDCSAGQIRNHRKESHRRVHREAGRTNARHSPGSDHQNPSQLQSE